jgi:hypothetical protein
MRVAFKDGARVGLRRKGRADSRRFSAQRAAPVPGAGAASRAGRRRGRHPLSPRACRRRSWSWAAVQTARLAAPLRRGGCVRCGWRDRLCAQRHFLDRCSTRGTRATATPPRPMRARGAARDGWPTPAPPQRAAPSSADGRRTATCNAPTCTAPPPPHAKPHGAQRARAACAAPTCSSTLLYRVCIRSPYLRADETCPVSTGGGTRRVHLVREGGGGRHQPGDSQLPSTTRLRAGRARGQTEPAQTVAAGPPRGGAERGPAAGRRTVRSRRSERCGESRRRARARTPRRVELRHRPRNAARRPTRAPRRAPRRPRRGASAPAAKAGPRASRPPCAGAGAPRAPRASLGGRTSTRRSC